MIVCGSDFPLPWRMLPGNNFKADESVSASALEGSILSGKGAAAYRGSLLHGQEQRGEKLVLVNVFKF